MAAYKKVRQFSRLKFRRGNVTLKRNVFYDSNKLLNCYAIEPLTFYVKSVQKAVVSCFVNPLPYDIIRVGDFACP